MRIGSLFSGVGGLELGIESALRSAGHNPEVVWQVEINPFCRSVLAKHWPNATRYTDVKEANPEPVDLIVGGFPCQDILGAGSGKGLAGDRSGLWFEFARIVEHLRPEWVVIENVASGAVRWVDAVRSGLERLGYATLPVPLSAADVGAPHLRRRIFIVAHTHSRGREGERLQTGGGVEGPPRGVADGRLGARSCDQRDARQATAHAESDRVQGLRDGAAGARAVNPGGHWDEGSPVSPVCGVDDGVPRRVDRLRALGNAVVPQCAEVIGWIIAEHL